METLRSKHIAARKFDRAQVQRIHADWAKCIGRNVADYEGMYQDHLQNLRSFLATPPQKSLFSKFFGKASGTHSTAGAAQYRFALCFASTKFLTGHGARQAAHQQLNLVHDAHLALIDALLDLPDRTVTDTTLPRNKGTLGEVIQAALLVYNSHTDFGPQGLRLRQEASLRVPKLLTRFPYLFSNITVSLLGLHPEVVEQTAQLITRSYSEGDLPPDLSVFPWIALEMVGSHARRDAPFRKAGPKVAARVLELGAPWSPERLGKLADAFVRAPLSLTDPAKRTDAARTLATSPAPRKVVALFAKALGPDQAADLVDLLAQAEDIRTRPQTFAMPKRGQNQFKDFGFKLIVIEELMKAQKTLRPAFDIYIFAREWAKRDISVEDDGYEIIPEARQYFEALPIAPELLAQIEIITQKSGLDGSGGMMDQLMPFWDPGSGDGPVPVTNKAVADLDLLPNLKCVVGLEHEVNTPRPTKLFKELDRRGINMIDEDLALWGRP